MDNLNTALNNIRRSRSDLKVYLNMIPINFSVVDDESLKQLNLLNRKYISILKSIINNYNDMDISIHSVDRNLSLLVQREFTNRKVGFVLSNLDLTPTDVSYYVFPSYMIDDNIFEELIERNKKI